MSRLTLVFLFFAIPTYAQNVSLYRNQCLTGTKGSRRAAEFYNDLKKQPASPERDEALNVCDARVQTLRKAEDDKWERAAQARQAGQCATAKTLFNDLANPGNQTFYQKQAGDEARTLNCTTVADPGGGVPAVNACADAQSNLRNATGKLNNNLFDDAKKYALAAQACAASSAEAAALITRIDVSSRSQKLVQSATIALRRGDKDSACKDILQVPDANYRGLKDLRTQAGGCEVPVVVALDPPPKPKPSTPPADPYLADYNTAISLENRRPAEAERIYQRILKSQPDYKDVQERIKQVQENQRINDFQVMATRARTQLDKGDLQAAFGSIERALTLRPGDPTLRDIKQLVEERLAKESSELGSGINAYYAGNYGEARKLLTAFTNSSHSARVIALANFYAGASSASEYYLGGQSDESKKEEARKAFSTLKDDRVFSPDWSIVKVSPKIRSLYLESAGKSAQ